MVELRACCTEYQVNAVELKDYLDRAEDSTFLHVLLDAGVDPFKVPPALRIRVRVKWGPGCLIRVHSQVGHFIPGPNLMYERVRIKVRG